MSYVRASRRQKRCTRECNGRKEERRDRYRDNDRQSCHHPTCTNGPSAVSSLHVKTPIPRRYHFDRGGLQRDAQGPHHTCKHTIWRHEALHCRIKDALASRTSTIRDEKKTPSAGLFATRPRDSSQALSPEYLRIPCKWVPKRRDFDARERKSIRRSPRSVAAEGPRALFMVRRPP